jgi:hypothetical protein
MRLGCIEVIEVAVRRSCYEGIMSIQQLMEAVRAGDVAKVERLLETGADVNGHGDEQEWTPLNYAAGRGDLQMVKLLLAKGANVFNVGRDRRTPHQIALAASHAEVARFLKEAEEKAGGDKDQISSRAGEHRQYCKAYHLREMRRFADWSESKLNWKEEEDEADSSELVEQGFSDDAVVFIHQDLTVTQSMWHNENVIFNQVTAAWREFCAKELRFEVPTDFDLIHGSPLGADDSG